MYQLFACIDLAKHHTMLVCMQLHEQLVLKSEPVYMYGKLENIIMPRLRMRSEVYGSVFVCVCVSVCVECCCSTINEVPEFL